MALETAQQRRQDQRRLAASTVVAARGAWDLLDRGALDASTPQYLSRILPLLTAAQLTAARGSEQYVSAALAEQGLSAEPEGEVQPEAFSGAASDGRSLDTLLAYPIVRAKSLIGDGATVDNAMGSARGLLDMIVNTQVADAGRAADGVAVASRPGVGYVRHLTPPSCGRCVVLAGRFYRYNDGFARHPNCDCTHAPASQSTSGDLTSNPQGYFDSLSENEQNKAFTRSGAQAIRDGADINQVVNARRGALGLSQAGRLTRAEQRMLRGGRDRGQLQRTEVFGRQLATTTEGTTVRGVAGRRLARRGGTFREQGERMRRARAPRLMPESIYEIAEDRAHVIELLRLNGYIT